MILTIFLCHSESKLKVNVLKVNSTYLSYCSKHVVVINSDTFNLNEQEILPNNLCLVDNDKLWIDYKEKHDNLLFHTVEEVRDYYFRTGIKQNKFIISKDEIIFTFLYYKFDDFSYHKKLMDYYKKEYKDYYEDIIVTNDSFILVNNISNFVNSFVENIEMTTLCVSHKQFEHGKTDLVRYSKDGFVKFMKYVNNNFIDIEVSSSMLKMNSSFIFKDYNYVYNSNECKEDINYDTKYLEKYIENGYQILKIKRLSSAFYNFDGIPHDFNTKKYKEINKDLVTLKTNTELINHFLHYGIKEGRLYKDDQPIIYPTFIKKLLIEKYYIVCLHCNNINNFKRMFSKNKLFFYNPNIIMYVTVNNEETKSFIHGIFPFSNIKVLSLNLFVESILVNMNDLRNIKEEKLINVKKIYFISTGVDDNILKVKDIQDTDKPLIYTNNKECQCLNVQKLNSNIKDIFLRNNIYDKYRYENYLKISISGSFICNLSFLLCMFKINIMSELLNYKQEEITWKYFFGLYCLCMNGTLKYTNDNTSITYKPLIKEEYAVYIYYGMLNKNIEEIVKYIKEIEQYYFVDIYITTLNSTFKDRIIELRDYGLNIENFTFYPKDTQIKKYNNFIQL